MSPHLLILQHEEEAPAGWLGERWRERAVQLEVIRTDQGELDPSVSLPDLRSVDALVVLGGAMGANDDTTHPWIPRAKELIRAALDADLPFLGVCLGHQLATVALGGEVRSSPSGRTIGTVPLALTEQGQDDPLLRAVAGQRVTHYNNDVATRLPAGATTLATTDEGHVQAARFGPHAWGVQFHPEVTPQDFALWMANFSTPGEDIDPEAIGAEVIEQRVALRHTGFAIADAFLDLVRAAPERSETEPKNP